MSILWTLVLKDLKLFLSDRRALLISLVVPIMIATFMAMVFGSSGQAKPASAIPMLVVDNEGSDASRAIVEQLKASGVVTPKVVAEAEARKSVQSGDFPVAIVLPKNFSAEVTAAMMAGGKKPELQLLTDPAQATASLAVRGVVAQSVMKAVMKESPSIQNGDGLPFETASQNMTKEETGEQWSGTAHAFAGMAVQGLLFGAIEAAMGLMRDRQQGLWKRLRAAPVPPYLLLLGRLLSTAIRSLFVIVALFGFGALVFKFKITGSWIGMGLVSVSVALMVASFGLFIAALGRTEQQSRGLSILVVLLMTMLGGAWFPIFLMPGWVQTLSLGIPARWAVDGFDGMTWRGLGLQQILVPCAVMLGFGLLFSVIAVTRFRWEAEPA